MRRRLKQFNKRESRRPALCLIHTFSQSRTPGTNRMNLLQCDFISLAKHQKDHSVAPAQPSKSPGEQNSESPNTATLLSFRTLKTEPCNPSPCPRSSPSTIFGLAFRTTTVKEADELNAKLLHPPPLPSPSSLLSLRPGPEQRQNKNRRHTRINYMFPVPRSTSVSTK